MDKALLNRLMCIAVGGLLIAGILFLGFYLFKKREDNMGLFFGLFCVTLGNLLNIVRQYIK